MERRLGMLPADPFNAASGTSCGMRTEAKNENTTVELGRVHRDAGGDSAAPHCLSKAGT